MIDRLEKRKVFAIKCKKYLSSRKIYLSLQRESYVRNFMSNQKEERYEEKLFITRWL